LIDFIGSLISRPGTAAFFIARCNEALTLILKKVGEDSCCRLQERFVLSFTRKIAELPKTLNFDVLQFRKKWRHRAEGYLR